MKPKLNHYINKNGWYWSVVLKKCGGDETKAERSILQGMLRSQYYDPSYILKKYYKLPK